MSATSPGKPANPAAVSRVLAAGGHERAESEATAVRGYRRYASGFEVRRINGDPDQDLPVSGVLAEEMREGDVLVAHNRLDSYLLLEPDRPRSTVADAVEAYATTLRRAGYAVEVRHRGASLSAVDSPYLVVTGRERNAEEIS